jgi:hypothetical protein
MNHGKKLLLLPVLLVLATLFLAVKIHAQTPSNYDVTVSPIYFDLSADPGTSITSKVRIRNNTTSPIPLKLDIEKLTGDINGNVTLKQDKNDYTLSWIKFDSDSVVIKPLEWTEVPFTINIPKDAAYGYYWTITMAQDKTNPLTKSAVNLTGAAGIPVLLNVHKEGAIMKGSIMNFSTDASFYEYPPITFTTKFQNNGNVHIRPKGNIFVKDWLGREVAVIDVNQTQGSVLPNSARIFQGFWDDGFITVETKMEAGQPKLDKNGKAEKTLKIRWDRVLDLRIGRYTASELMVLSTPTKDISYVAETSFFIFPWKVVLGALVFALFAGVGFYSTLKNFVKRVTKIFGFGKKENEI